LVPGSPTYGGVYKIEEKVGGSWVARFQAAYNETNGRVIRTTDANNKGTVFTSTEHPGG
jgi:hypothetical protein